ncbi:LamG domain-containing protein [Rubellicoccus peritrichatus]|uniref:LamG domain-containing protein n=1 Tax=Rubellicoccus peritrichatus TaxID=3080537 RepID=A0AAQ3L8R3_9BACT|nr:LamG domain-containing protein [Puniceicoccus sp. CR14]WOO39772.1 LamG domain-containing protein [Puniceicoccus sp. CR14]
MKLLLSLPIILAIICFTSPAFGQTYLDRLNPVAHVHFDTSPGQNGESVILGNGTQLTRPDKFAGTSASGAHGPHSWTGHAWDFSKIDGPYLLKVNEAMSRVGDIEKTDGFTVSFWVKGEYSGRTSRIMNGPFDIGTNNFGIWGGSNDYQNASTPRNNPIWDNKWHHIVIRVDFKGKLDNIQIYVDGKLAGKKSGAYMKMLKTSIGRTWSIGARNPSDPGYDFGALADIAIFDRQLTDNEIAYINAGPVFAGEDQEVILPNHLTLQGYAPLNSSIRWQQKAGPQTIQFKDQNRETAYVKFEEPGDYEFSLTSGNNESTVKVKVLANQPPHVLAGNGFELESTHDTGKLNGFVEDNSIGANQKLSTKWTVEESPDGSQVRFSDDRDVKSEVSFDMPGHYKLRLNASDGELTSHSDLSVLVASPNSRSYLAVLNPLMLVDFDEPAHSGPDAFTDATKSTGLKLRYAENGIPTMTPGARNFTGYGWDFSASDSDIEIINSAHLEPVHNREHPARSLSFWVKGNAETQGYITALLGILPMDKAGRIRNEIHGLTGIAPIAQDLRDNQWHHIAVVIKTEGENITRALYIDGQKVGEVADKFAHANAQFSSADLRHSQFIASRGRSGRDNFNGQLDDFAVFDYELSADDIAYIMNGPGPEDDAILEIIDEVVVDAGPNIYQMLPGENAVELQGQIENSSGLTPVWRKLSGNGDVTFQNPNEAITIAEFDPVEDDKDGVYSKFLLQLALEDDKGRIIAQDNVTVLFYPERAPAIRELTSTPEPGVHPRVLFTKEDLPELRHKATTVPVVMRANSAMQARAKRLKDSNDSYGSIYMSLLNGTPVSLQSVYGDNAGGFFLVLLEASYLAWLGTDGQSNIEELTELSKVFSIACEEKLTWYQSNHTNTLVHDVNWAVGLCYDILYNWMDDKGRNDARKLLARMTAHRQPIGSTSLPQDNSSNWKGYHDHIILSLLAIEGEPGFDENSLDNIEHTNAEFLTQYGVFESGLPHEGYGYYTFGMTWHSLADLAISRRDNREKIVETTRFYPAIETIFRLMDPNGKSIKSHHDVVGGKSGSGEIGLPPRHLIIAKYLWPDDERVDYVYGKLIENLMNDQDRRFDIFHAIFGEPVAYPDQTLDEAAGELDPVLFCPDRGIVLARDFWDKEGIRLDFRCRMDKYFLGHQHSDVNSFELWALGREWIIDRGKFGGTINDIGSTVLIDGVSANSSKRNAWPSMPGKFLEFVETDDVIIGVGDAKPFFDYTFGKPQSGPQELVTDHGLMWSDFYFEREGETIPKWMLERPIDMNGYGHATGIYRMNPVNQAIRTAILQRGANPFVLIIDDVEKDGKPHDYTWIANTVIGDQMVKVSSDKEKLILRHKEDVNGGPRLLVKVLEAKGQSAPINLEHVDLKVGKDTIKSVRISIPTKNVVRPEFKVMLFPFMDGDELPQTEWNSDYDQLIVTVGGESYEYDFVKTDSGQTKTQHQS